MVRKILYIAITLIAFNMFCGFNIQRIPRWFQAQWDYYNGKYVSSSEHYEKACDGDTDSVMQYNHGDAQYRDGDFEAAEELYTKAVESNSEFVDAYYNQGNARFRQGNLEGAVESYENALEIDPEHEDARYNLEYVKKLLEQQNNTGDNADSQEDKHSQNPQSSEKEGQSDRDEQPEDSKGGNSDEGSESKDAGESASGMEQESDEQMGESGSGNSGETEEEQPSEAKQSNSSGLSDEMVDQILEALAEEEKALAGQLERRQRNEDDEMNDPFGIFNDLWSIPDDLDPFAKKKRKNRDKEEVDW